MIASDLQASLRYDEAELDLLPLELSQKQVAFAEDVLGLTRGECVLDVGCGIGRHSLELARRGYRATGLDLDDGLLATAASRARGLGLDVRFIKADMRAIPFDREFDAALSLYTTFGYFLSDEDDRQALHAIRRTLRRRSRFLIDVLNRDYMVLQEIAPFTQPLKAWKSDETHHILEEFRFDARASRLQITKTIFAAGSRRVVTHSIRLYACHELCRMLEETGFAVDGLFGAFDKTPFGVASPRLIATARAT